MRDRQGSSLYRRLQVAPGASREEIVHAYRRLARSLHPDARPGDPDAAVRFGEVTEAYEVLADPGRRAEYDRQAGGTPVEVRVVGPAPGGPRRGPTATHHEGAPVVLGVRASSVHEAVFRAGPVQVEGVQQAGAVDPDVSTRSIHDLLRRLAEGWGWC
jgi:DnaJ-class molecular chaperone